MYRLIVESLLGLQLKTDGDGARLVLSPCLPDDWPGYGLEYRFGRTHYQIEITQVRPAADAIEVRLDGELQAGRSVPLVDDGRPHRVAMRC
jgi:cellobiose phosphorylase